MKNNIEFYLKQLESLQFQEVSDETWETIQDEGLDEEFDLFYRNDYQEALLPISSEDKIGLMNLTEEMLNKFNEFDINLKENFHMKYIDFINYDNGSVKIIKIIQR